MNDDITTEQQLAARRYQNAARDLKQIVREIAARYIVQGVPLTWRLLHAIEAEALADLGFASRHDALMLGLFQRPSELPYPETDEVVDFGSSNALPPVFAFAVAAFAETVPGSMPAVPKYRATKRARAWGG
jgi:hypothetical protein